MTMSVLGRFAHNQLINAEDELAVIQAEIIRMKIKTAHPLLPIASLSGGNQQKAVVDKICCRIRRCDSRRPTHGVDVGAKYEITSSSSNSPGRRGHPDDLVRMPEILGIADRVLVIGEGS